MTEHRQVGPARIRPVNLSLRRRLELSLWLVLLLGVIASAVGWLPDWVRFAVLAVFVVDVVRNRIPGVLRLDPDYRKRP